MSSLYCWRYQNCEVQYGLLTVGSGMRREMRDDGFSASGLWYGLRLEERRRGGGETVPLFIGQHPSAVHVERSFTTSTTLSPMPRVRAETLTRYLCVYMCVCNQSRINDNHKSKFQTMTG